MFDHIQPVTLSERAVEEVRKIMQTKNIPSDYSLRVGIKGGGGCGGASFVLGFDKKKDSDQQYSIGEIPVIIDRKHTLYLMGKAVDFVETADARGFTFIDQPRDSAAADTQN